MIWLGNKLFVFLIELCLVFLNLAISFLTNIAVYEVTEGLTFNWSKLFHSPWFWVIFVCQLLFGIVSAVFQHRNKVGDNKLDKVLEKNLICLSNQIPTYTKMGDFESAEKVLEMFDKLCERRHQ